LPSLPGKFPALQTDHQTVILPKFGKFRRSGDAAGDKNVRHVSAYFYRGQDYPAFLDGVSTTYPPVRQDIYCHPR